MSTKNPLMAIAVTSCTAFGRIIAFSIALLSGPSAAADPQPQALSQSPTGTAELIDSSLPVKPGTEVGSGLVFGTDNRVAMTDSFFSSRPQWRAFGLLDLPSGGFCSATHFAQNHIITARHCFGDTENPANIVFRPAFTGARTMSNYNQRPSIRGRRVVRGTGSVGKINDGGTYVPGGDWMIVELDPATYVRGTPATGSGIPTFPTTFNGWQTIPIFSLNKPIPTAGVTVSAFGYSGDFLSTNNAAGYHLNCRLRKDGVCSTDAVQRGEGMGAILADCDWNPGASGGPAVTGTLDSPGGIVAVHGGGGSGVTGTWTEANANRDISSNAWAFAPVRAAGFTATVANGNSMLLGVGTDSVFFNGIRQVNLSSADGYRAADQWYDFRDAGTTPVAVVFGRATSAYTIDGHAWIFAVASGQIWNKMESSPGVWQDWQTWFPGSTMGTSPLDLEARSAGTAAVQLYTVHSNGAVRTRRKLNTWNAAWQAETSLGTVTGAHAIAASDTGGFQQIFVATSSGLQTKWEINGPSSNQWSSFVNFADGLPTGLTLLDIAAGTDNSGRMDVYLLARTSTQTRIYQRAKTSTVPGSAWGSWVLLDSDAKLTGATQVEIMTRSGATGFAPRLVVIRDGELLTRRPANPTFPDAWVPLYSPANVTCP